MALRLQLENGKIKTYKTSFGIDSVDPPEKGDYKTRCGKKWLGKPNLLEECDHLDCSIWANEQYFYTFRQLALIIAAFGILCYLAGLGFHNEFLIIFSPIEIGASVILTLFALYHYYKKSQLIEFRCRGTINGIKAHKL